MILQQQLAKLFDVAIPSRLRGATTPGIVLNIFPPFMKPSILAKNVGMLFHLHRLQAPFQVSVAGLKQNFIAARSLLDCMTYGFTAQQ